MSFRDWWGAYKLPAIPTRNHFDLLRKVANSAYNAGRKAAKAEERERRLEWQMKQNNLSASSGRSCSTID